MNPLALSPALGDSLFLVGGLVALLGGGDALVRGAVALAARLGVAPVLIGLTVVAFGTSAPELVVNLLAALRGSPDLGFGNVVGSNIANLGLILGGAAVLAPVAVHPSLLRRDLPLLLGASAVMLAMGAERILYRGFGRLDGVVLLTLFVVFLGLTIREGLRGRDGLKPDLEPEPVGTPDAPPPAGTLRLLLLLGAGLLALILGGELTVRGAVGLATTWGISETVVGLTVVALGTSLPELATSLLAARRGQGDVAMGNVVGSNLFNLLFIWGTTVTVAPSIVPPRGEADLLVMVGFTLAVLLLVVRRRRLGRRGGVFLLCGYLGYVAWLAVR